MSVFLAQFVKNGFHLVPDGIQFSEKDAETLNKLGLLKVSGVPK
jgi:hypothetical protein